MRLLGPVTAGPTVPDLDVYDNPIAGTGVASARTPVRVIGEILGMYVKYNDSPPGTTVVTISTEGVSPAIPPHDLLVLSNVNTDGMFRPALQAVDGDGAPIAGAYVPALVYDYVTVDVDGTDGGESVVVWFLLK